MDRWMSLSCWNDWKALAAYESADAAASRYVSR